ncbi:MAG TPA: type II and III secretion system protein family protein [Azospirillum sp.]|nr:type II and III secretion system protein family protein [Azospirillum sp.]
MNIRSFTAIVCALSLSLCFGRSADAAEPSVRIETANPRLAGEIQLPVNKSRVLRVDRPVTDILVGSPEVADVMALSDRSVYVLGRKLGSTSLALYGENRQLIAVMDLTITPDLPTLRQRLHEIMPRERIDVRAANESVVLSGPVSNGSQLKQALAIAESFAPGKVTNMMTLTGGQQVMLAVRFAEVQRTAAKELGISTNVKFAAGNSALAIATGIVPALAPFATARAVLATGNWTIDALLDALEQKGVIKTLAEPNLIAMSGETASFLAGGEFPIPVGTDEDNGRSRIHIEFKEFGVKLAFTPTVVGGDVINLVVRPEVSAIDRANGITVTGLVIPGLTVRRAHTTVDLRHGESFAIAGLIRSNFSDTVDQLPGLGNIPILGTLFRSSSFQREETELVIIVTPYLARPAQPGQLRLPTDAFRPPTETQLFLNGRVDGSPLPGQGGAPGATMPPGAGLAGTVGYVVK